LIGFTIPSFCSNWSHILQDNFDRVSRMVKKEVELFDVRRAEEFKKGVVAYLEAMLKAQEGVAAHWERYLPEIQQINHKQQ
jgi:hypothetical protein